MISKRSKKTKADTDLDKKIDKPAQRKRVKLTDSKAPADNSLKEEKIFIKFATKKEGENILLSDKEEMKLTSKLKAEKKKKEKANTFEEFLCKEEDENLFLFDPEDVEPTSKLKVEKKKKEKEERSSAKSPHNAQAKKKVKDERIPKNSAIEPALNLGSVEDGDEVDPEYAAFLEYCQEKPVRKNNYKKNDWIFQEVIDHTYYELFCDSLLRNKKWLYKVGYGSEKCHVLKCKEGTKENPCPFWVKVEVEIVEELDDENLSLSSIAENIFKGQTHKLTIYHNNKSHTNHAPAEKIDSHLKIDVKGSPILEEF